MIYSIEPGGRIDVKGYWFLSFAKKLVHMQLKLPKKMSKKYGQKLIDSSKKSTTDAKKKCFKKSNSKTAGTTGDLIDN